MTADVGGKWRRRPRRAADPTTNASQPTARKGPAAQPPRAPFAPWLRDALLLAARDAARWISKPPHRRARRRRARGCRPSCMRFRSDSFRSRALGFPVRDPRSSGFAALGRSRERRVGGFYRFVLSIAHAIVHSRERVVAGSERVEGAPRARCVRSFWRQVLESLRGIGKNAKCSPGELLRKTWKKSGVGQHWMHARMLGSLGRSSHTRGMAASPTDCILLWKTVTG